MYTTTTLARLDVAGRLHDQLCQYPNFIVTNTMTVLPSVAYYLRMLDHRRRRLDDADVWFQRAETVHDRLDSLLLRTCNDVAWAALLADRGNAEDLVCAHFCGARPSPRRRRLRPS